MLFKNNFGILRLLLASLVIFSHSPEIIDGNRSGELLTQIFHTISLGELAISGFFLISGYLILKSFERTQSTRQFIYKRVLRIFPGFIAASLFCILIVAPLSGGIAVLQHLSIENILTLLSNLLILERPEIAGVFADNHYQTLNGSMWSVWVEFLCYLSIPVFAVLGLYRKNLFVLTTLIVASIYLFLTITGKDIWLQFPLRLSASASSRLLLAFLVGSAFYIFRDKIKWSKSLSAIAFVLFIVCLMYKETAVIGSYVFGGYLLFNFAFNFQNTFINSIGQKTDISYGVYLYAWPIQSLLVQYIPDIDAATLSKLTLLFTASLGYLSWRYVEKPFLAFKKQHVLKPATRLNHFSFSEL